jgi:hypothetical protein
MTMCIALKSAIPALSCLLSKILYIYFPIVSVLGMSLRCILTTIDLVPAGRYARSLRLMLRSARRRRVLPQRPAGPVDRAGNPPVLFGTPPTYIDSNSPQQFLTASPGTHGDSSVSPHTAFNIMASNGMVGPGQEFDPYLQGFELAPGQEVPVWLSETNLGDAALSQFGLEAFVIPPQYDPNSTETQIW